VLAKTLVRRQPTQLAFFGHQYNLMIRHFTLSNAGSGSLNSPTQLDAVS
jgi:hypothetical protein